MTYFLASNCIGLFACLILNILECDFWVENRDGKNKFMAEKTPRGVIRLEKRDEGVRNSREELPANDNFEVNLQPMRFN
jgi:hypothetical protein